MISFLRFTVILFTFLPPLIYAQSVPTGINYQAIARGSDGKELPDHQIGLEFIVLEGTTEQYREQHTVTTNSYGLFTVVIGEGVPQGSSTSLQQVNWRSGNIYFIVGVDENGGNSYQYLDTVKFQTVPYAFFAPGQWQDNAGSIYPQNTSDNVGIGNTNPQYKLDVTGDINTTTGYMINGTAPNGEFLKGNGTVFTSSPIVNSDLPPGPASWTKTGNNLYSSPTDNIGIGTSSPVYKVDVSGVVRSSGGFLDGSGTPPSGNFLRSNGTSFVSAAIQPADLPLGATAWSRTGTNVYLTTSTHNVGIGTSSPGFKLDVSGVVNASTGYRVGGAASAQGTYLRSNGTNFVPASIDSADLPGNIKAWARTGTNVHLITHTDRVGIGTTSPLSTGGYSAVGPLTNKGGVTISSIVNYTVDAPAVLELKGSTDAAGEEVGMLEYISRGNNNQDYNVARITAVREDPSNVTHTSLAFYTRSFASLTEKMRITSTGSFGFGTTNPGTFFDVSPPGSGYIRMNRASTSSPAGFALSTAGNWRWYLFSPAGGENLAIYNGTNSQYVMFIQSNNWIGFNETTPATQFHFTHTSGTTNGISFQNTVDTDRWHWYVYSTNDLTLFFNGALRGSFDYLTGIYSTASDRSLKKDITPFTGALEKVRKLQPVLYNFKHEDKPTGKHTGFIAQDVKEILPSLVHFNDESGIYTLDYSGFGVVAIGAIQEMEAKYDSEISELKAQIRQLEEVIKQLQPVKEDINR